MMQLALLIPTLGKAKCSILLSSTFILLSIKQTDQTTMRLEWILDFSPDEYTARIRQYEIQHLREQEIVKSRQVLRAGPSIYATRAGERAEAKLKIIQAELTGEEIPLHEPNENDDDAAAVAIVAGQIASEDLEGVMWLACQKHRWQHWDRSPLMSRWMSWLGMRLRKQSRNSRERPRNVRDGVWKSIIV